MGNLFYFIILGLFCSFISANGNAILKEAKQAFSRKAYMESIKKFTKYSERHPTDGESFMYMGYIYEYKKDYSKSIQNFRKAAELNLERDQKKTVLLKLALFFNYRQEWNLAAVYSARYLKYDSKNEEIQKIYNRAIGNHSPSTKQSDQKISEEKPHLKHTPSIDEKNTEDFKSSREYEKELVIAPNNEELRWEYSLALFEEGKYDQVEENIKILIEKNPARSRYHYKLGIVKLRKDDPKAAIESFERARKNPFSIDTNIFLYYVFLNEGIAYQKLNQFDQAEASFKSSHKQLNKETPLLALAKLYHQGSNWAACAETAEKAIAIAGQIETHMFRFICLAEEDKKGRGIESSFEKYFEYLESNFAIPQKAPLKFKVGFLRLARHLTILGKEIIAEKYFGSLEDDTEINLTREYLFYRGKNLFYLNQIDKSISLLQKVTNSSASFYLLARAFAKNGNINLVKSNLNSAGQMKAEYWEMAKKESDFLGFRKEKSFSDFLDTKGGSAGSTSLPK